jgi:TPR repeat protein
MELIRESAEAGVPSALYDLAASNEMVTGVRKSLVRAAEFYVQAALLGDKQSVYEAGRCYYHGIGVQQNRRIARVWLDRASQLGVED